MEDPILAELRALREEVHALRRERRTDARARVTASEAARMLGIDRGRVARAVAAGLLRGVQEGRDCPTPGGRPSRGHGGGDGQERDGRPA